MEIFEIFLIICMYIFLGAVTAAGLAAKFSPRIVVLGTIFWWATLLIAGSITIGKVTRTLYYGIAYNSWEKPDK